MKCYEFKITMQGFGDDSEDAWLNAIEGFIQEPRVFNPSNCHRVPSNDEDEPCCGSTEPRKLKFPIL